MTVTAILGATGHVGQALTDAFLRRGETLVLLARDPTRLRHLAGPRVATAALAAQADFDVDVIINCIGAGDPGRVRDMGREIVEVTERHDLQVLRYLETHPRTTYVFLSSGVAADAMASPMPNWYAESKVSAERRHRVLADLNIVDLRVYGFASRFLDVSGRFFLAELFASILRGQVFTVGSDEMWRDYLHADDLAQLIECCVSAGPLNRAIAAHSRAPASKAMILDRCRREFGLRVRAVEREALATPADLKNAHYYAIDHEAASIGYSPRYSSEETVVDTGRAILAAASGKR